MKPKAFGWSLAVTALILFNLPAQAATPERIMAKVRYDRFAGPQRDWPQSKEPVVASKIARDMAFFDKLPDRPYEVLGVMRDEGDMSVKHVAQAARLVGADALLTVNDKAFGAAGIKFEPRLLEHADIPDPRGPRTIGHLQQPDALKTRGQPATIRVTQVEVLLIRWKAR